MKIKLLELTEKEYDIKPCPFCKIGDTNIQLKVEYYNKNNKCNFDEFDFNEIDLSLEKPFKEELDEKVRSLAVYCDYCIATGPKVYIDNCNKNKKYFKAINEAIDRWNDRDSKELN